jgi:uncharacterized protein YndB with AHSA1/START domain
LGKSANRKEKAMLTQADKAIPIPDLSSRPHNSSAERVIDAPPGSLYDAFTTGIDGWFAAPGTLAMSEEIGAPFFFETQHAGQRYPHYGRFLRLEPGRLVELTWVTGKGGTEGAETVLTVELLPSAGGTLLKLRHAGFPHPEAAQENQQAWRGPVLDALAEHVRG